MVDDKYKIAGLAVLGLLGWIMYNNYRIRKEHGHLHHTEDHMINEMINPYYRHQAIPRGIEA